MTTRVRCTGMYQDEGHAGSRWLKGARHGWKDPSECSGASCEGVESTQQRINESQRVRSGDIVRCQQSLMQVPRRIEIFGGV